MSSTPKDPPKDLREFLSLLARERELVTIDATVNPDLEVAEIHRRVIAANGPALLFNSVQGSKFKLVTNLFGNQKRVDLAFGSKPGLLVKKLTEMPEKLLPPTVAKIWDHRDVLKQLLKVGLSKGRFGAIGNPVRAYKQSPAQLTSLPLIKSWKEDGAAFFTLPLVYTQDPLSHIPNLGMYRLQRFNDHSTGFHAQIGKGAGFHLYRARELKQKLPVNVFLGGAPALILAAIAPLPENVPELLFASLVLGQKLKMCNNPSGPLPLVSNCEFALVGSVDPNVVKPEGPFGDHYGYYSLKHDYPVFSVDAVYHRKDAILPATVVGKPRQEDFYLGDYLQELLAPCIKLVMPAVKDIWSYGETGYHSLTAAVVSERYKREALSSAFRILGEGQLSLTKFLLLTNHSQDLKDFRSLLTYILARADFATDFYIFSNTSMDTLDYSGPKVNEGSKGLLLGIGDPIRELPNKMPDLLPRGIGAAEIFCPGCLVIDGPSQAEVPDLAKRLTSHPGLKSWPLIVLVDDAKKAAKSSINFLWTTFTRFEPAQDIYARERTIIRNHISYTPPIVIDARLKPNFPAELFCDEKTHATVSKRWTEYFSAGMEMGDSDKADLD